MWLPRFDRHSAEPPYTDGQASAVATSVLERLREAEALRIRPYLRAGARILEIGAGTGFQAGLFHRWGFPVTAIDVAVRTDAVNFWPVMAFDGLHLPFEDASFDVTFTSNVLEHVARRPELLKEMVRVLKPGGYAIHIVPSATWRVWTSVARYIVYLRRAGRRAIEPSSVVLPGRAAGHLSSLADRLLGPPHGEYATTLKEMSEFRRSRWHRIFDEDFESVSVFGTRLFYSGYTIFEAMPLSARRALSRVLGSSCHVFVLRPRHSHAEALDPRVRAQ